MSEHLKVTSTRAKASPAVNAASRTLKKKKEPPTSTSSPPVDAAIQLATLLKAKWKRHAPYNFVGCLAHVDITFQSTDGQVLRVVGYLDHNEECQKARMGRNPPIPLYPHVYRLALQQLQAGSDLHSIKTFNRKMIDQRLYHGMGSDSSQWNFRYLILRTDSSRLYRMLSRRQGITTKTPAEVNVHQWLDPTSKHFQPILYNAVLHYQPRTEAKERFSACIASAEMEKATWKYGHRSQIILDGTFGLCDSRLLLFIVMAVDEEGHGVPLCFMLFSAPTGNRQTSAGYDTEVLKELLQKWKDWLSSRSGRLFEPLVAITDTDTKERGALLVVFPTIILLLCKFHLRQCWTNRRRQLLGPVDVMDFAKQQVKSELQVLEIGLIDSSNYTTAMKLITDQQERFRRLEGYPGTAPLASAALQYLDYLIGYWMAQPLWASWSAAGRNKAAKAMATPVHGVLPTTNHLESFNRLLKRGHLRRLENQTSWNGEQHDSERMHPKDPPQLANHWQQPTLSLGHRHKQ
ncbi:hypothetical protein M407DRAFT_25419 [Tulasnella calospora MUT 4182]|uniref:MULE transposase domain-containing protein n=1 Tax=Tulasnella calospora MUT 4182 TaxID=1051891 RepID=A0A0C3Q6W1_9AGAM|nr:hypothetical protein M407DRAFT_25419 [Tulasnella calospora MUT 4182]